jgi:hypothetical protein
LPLACSVLILGVLATLGGRELYDALFSGAGINGENFPLIAEILKFSIVKWLLGAVIYLTGTFAVIMLSVFIALIITGFLTPVITAEINKRHYGLSDFADISAARSAKLIGIALLKFLGLLSASLMLLPILWFMPILNLIVMQIPFFYLYYSITFLDVAPNTLRKTKFELYLLDFGGYKFKAACLLFYLLCLVPLVGILGQIYFIIYFSHFFLQKEKPLSA